MDLKKIEEKKQAKKEIKESSFLFIKDILIIILIILFLRAFIFLPFKISGPSMETAFYDRQYVIVRRISFINNIILLGNQLKRGDVVVFRPLINGQKPCFMMIFGFGCGSSHSSQNSNSYNDTGGRDFFIKRIIGMPGDEVKISGGFVYVKESGKEDFIKLEESYLSELNNGKTFVHVGSGSSTSGGVEKIYKVPEGEYFVLGDNRQNSVDSRSCFDECFSGGHSYFIAKKDIMGKMFLDFGYFDLFKVDSNGKTQFGKFGSLKFQHYSQSLNEKIGGSTFPKFFGAKDSWKYEELED